MPRANKGGFDFSSPETYLQVLTNCRNVRNAWNWETLSSETLLLLLPLLLLLLHLLRCLAPVVVDRDRLHLAQPNHTALRRQLRVASMLNLVNAKKICGLTRVRFLVEGESEQREAQPQQDEGRDRYASARVVLHVF